MSSLKTICVCGAGTMGSGIAQVSAQSGFDTIQFDVNSAMLTKSREAITQSLDWLVSKQKISIADKDACLGRIIFTHDIQQCKADLVIEAIVEKQEAKADLFNSLAKINTSQTIFATNTSSLAVTDIAAQISHPERLIGMHFFNPAPIMKLVEVVTTKYTSPEIIQSITELALQMHKTPVVCKDAPGFIVNRVARHYYLEAMHLVEKGLASIENVDDVLQASGFKMGPFRLMDLIGMDINFSVAKIVWESLGKPDRLIPSALQKQKVDSGELGRKTGKGFYVYEE